MKCKRGKCSFSGKIGEALCPDHDFFIIGPGMFQSEMIASYVRTRTGKNATPVSNSEMASMFSATKDQDAAKLILCDCFKETGENILEKVRFISQFHSPKDILVLINLDRDTSIESEALKLGVKGFYYQDEAKACLLDGVRLILDGELRIARKMLQDCYFNKESKEDIKNQQRESLSLREREILALLPLGIDNKTIAEQLCISPYTVKTHLYRIYKKIKVSNRLQASLWAKKQL